ncbi:MAG: pyridoxal-phosphate dependent enzyme, partial [Salinisphaeraceae bacterium]|nr:pyridoxal-phosphate dependent enzyme [Salinisphaeraceae bacterium]
KLSHAAVPSKPPAADTESANQVMAGMILHALQEHPERQALRYRLLQIYHDTGNDEGFLEHARIYRDNLRQGEENHWDSVKEMGLTHYPDESLFQAEATAAGETTSTSEEFTPQRRFGEIPEAKEHLATLAQDYRALRGRAHFLEKLDLELVRLTHRPTALEFVANLTQSLNGAQIFLKRDDQGRRDARLLIHLMGQAFIASELGKKRILFAASNGDEAVLAAQAAIRCQLKSSIYIHSEAVFYTSKHKALLKRMDADLLQIENKEVEPRQLMLEAWLKYPAENFMMLNLSAGPYPYPDISSDLQTTVGRECLRQMNSKTNVRLSAVIARGGYPDAIGLMEPFLKSDDVRLVLANGPSTYNEEISATDLMGYPSIHRELTWLNATGRVEQLSATNEDGLEALKLLARREGILVEEKHGATLAVSIECAQNLSNDDAIIVMLG